MRLISLSDAKKFRNSSISLIILSALHGFPFSHSRSGRLDLDKGAIRYDGSLVRGKMNGKGTVTFKNGDTYTGNLVNGSFSGYGKFKSKDGWTYEGQFVNGQPEGKGTLTTEANVVYKGTFKQGIYQNAH